MNVVVRKLRHRFHHHRKFLHARHILDDVKLGSSDSHVAKEMQEQIIAGAYTMNVTDRRISCAWICRDHHVTLLFRLNKLLRHVALDNFMREVPAYCLATERVNLKALLQCETARLQADVHEPGAREVGVSEYRDHQDYATYPNGGCYPGRLVFGKYDVLHRVAIRLTMPLILCARTRYANSAKLRLFPRHQA